MSEATSLITKTDDTEDFFELLGFLDETMAMEYIPLTKQSLLYCINGKKRYLNKKPGELLDFWCTANGSSLLGRLDAYKKMTSLHNKCPVLISERTMAMFFPMRSISYSGSNFWIKDEAIVTYQNKKRTSTVLVFYDTSRLEIPYDSRSLKHQITRCNDYRRLLLTMQRQQRQINDPQGKEFS